MPTLKAAIDASKSRSGADEFVLSSRRIIDAGKSVEKGVGGIASALSGPLVQGLVKTISSYEQLKASLVTVEKSQSKANATFAELQQFAKVTPFTTEQATKAWIRMRAAGLEPTIDKLRAFGDASSIVAGKDVLDFVEAVADATQGGKVRLKEFGIGMEKMGDQVQLKFGDMAIKVKNDAKSIEEGLIQLTKTNFGGAMARQSETLAGKWSTLKDNAANLAMQVGEGGLTAALKRLTDEFISTTEGSEKTARSFGELLGKGVDLVTWLVQESKPAWAAFDAHMTNMVDDWREMAGLERTTEIAIREAAEAEQKFAAAMSDRSSEQVILNVLTEAGGDYVKEYAAAYIDFGNKAPKAIQSASDAMNELYKAQAESKKKQQEISNLFLDAVDGLEGGGGGGGRVSRSEPKIDKKKIPELTQDILAWTEAYKAAELATTIGLHDAALPGGDLLGDLSKDLGTTGGKSVSDYIYDPEEDAKKAKEFSELWKDELSDVVKAQEKAIKNSPMDSFINQYSDLLSITEQWESLAVGGIENFSATLTEALMGGEVSWSDFYKSMAADITQLLIKMAIAAALKGIIGGATGGVGAALGAGMIGDLIVGSSFHSGGMVGSGGSPRMMDSSLFAGAPRYHSGGLVGLRPDEVPAILQRGERVQSRAEVARGGRDRANVTFVLPGVRDSRGFERNVDQQASRMRRILRGDE